MSKEIPLQSRLDAAHDVMARDKEEIFKLQSKLEIAVAELAKERARSPEIPREILRLKNKLLEAIELLENVDCCDVYCEGHCHDEMMEALSKIKGDVCTNQSHTFADGICRTCGKRVEGRRVDE